MEKKECLCNAIKKIFWGYIFLYFNINLGTIDILPGWIGYIFFYQAIRDGIAEEEESSKLLQPIGIILGIYNGITWILSILYIPTNIILVDMLIDVISLYFHFQLLTNLSNIARKYSCEQERSLLTLRTIQTILLTVLAVLVYFEELYEVAVILLIVQCVVVICLCIVLHKLKQTMDELPEEIFEKNILSD